MHIYSRYINSDPAKLKPLECLEARDDVENWGNSIAKTGKIARIAIIAGVAIAWSSFLATGPLAAGLAFAGAAISLGSGSGGIVMNHLEKKYKTQLEKLRARIDWNRQAEAWQAENNPKPAAPAVKPIAKAFTANAAQAPDGATETIQAGHPLPGRNDFKPA